MVIVSITDSKRVVLKEKKQKKKDSVKITGQAFHLPLGQIKSVGRAAFVMSASSYFLSAEDCRPSFRNSSFIKPGDIPRGRTAAD